MGKKYNYGYHDTDGVQWPMVAGVVGVALLIVGAVAWFGRPYELTGRLARAWWSRDVNVLRWSDGREDAKCEYCFGVSVPSGARDVRHWTSSYVTTSSHTDSRGNTTTSFDHHTVYHAEWRIFRWRNARTVNAIGFDREPRWPDVAYSAGSGAPELGADGEVHPQGRERFGGRSEQFGTVFVCEGKEREVFWTHDRWLELDRGASYRIRFGWFGWEPRADPL